MDFREEKSHTKKDRDKGRGKRESQESEELDNEEEVNEIDKNGHEKKTAKPPRVTFKQTPEHQSKEQKYGDPIPRNKIKEQRNYEPAKPRKDAVSYKKITVPGSGTDKTNQE